MQRQLDARFAEVERYIARVCAQGIPEELQSYLYRLGAIMICGNVERSVEIIVLDRLDRRAHPRVLSFIRSHFKRGTNYDCEAIEQLLVRFDEGWYRKFRIFYSENDDVKEGIASAYAIRNSVAHGGNQSLGNRRLQELASVSKKLLDGVVSATQH